MEHRFDSTFSLRGTAAVSATIYVLRNPKLSAPGTNCHLTIAAQTHTLWMHGLMNNVVLVSFSHKIWIVKYLLGYKTVFTIQ